MRLLRDLLGDLLRRDDGIPPSTMRAWGLLGLTTTKDTRVQETARRLAVLAILASVQMNAITRNGWHGVGLLAGIVSILCILGWACWVLALSPIWRFGQNPPLIGLLVLGTGGALLCGLLTQDSSSISPAFAVVGAVVLSVRLPPGRAALVVAGFEVVLLVTAATQGWHQLETNGLGYGALLAGMYGIGIGRRSSVLRAESAEKLVRETERANHEQAHAAALAERSRIAREIHDVLAHSLAALTVQLEAADALLEAGGEPSTRKAHDYVQKSRRIAREGLVETRRAIAALREDAPPLPELLNALAEAYRGDTGAEAELEIEGLPRPLQADAGLTVYRAGQESLTNVRKHAPGAPVWLKLVYAEEQVTLTVANGAPTEPRSALADSGGGYGLAGLKERAELIGGSLEAGPGGVGDGVSEAGPGWQVTLTLQG